MQKLNGALLATAVALVALLAITAGAAAFTVTIAPAGLISMASLGNLTFEGGVTVRCPVTLNGRLLSGPITIARGNTVGSVNEVFIDNGRCEGGSIRSVLVESGIRSWPIQINSVPTGLPNEVRTVELIVVGSKFDFAMLGGFVECLYEGNVPGSLAVTRTRTAGVYTTGLTTILTNTERFISGSGFCPRTGALRGTLGLTPVQTLTVQ